MSEENFIDKHISLLKNLALEPPPAFSQNVIKKIHILESRRRTIKALLPSIVAFSASALVGITLIILSVINLSASDISGKNLVSGIFSAQVSSKKFSISALHHCWHILENCRQQNCSCCQKN